VAAVDLDQTLPFAFMIVDFGQKTLSRTCQCRFMTLRTQRFIAGVVGNHPLFREAQVGDLAALAQQSFAVAVRRGDLLARQGDRVPGIFIVGYGLAKVALGRRKDRVLRLVGPGQCFGAAAAVLGRASPYDAIALRDSKLAVVPAAAVLQLLERDARFGRMLATLLAERSLELLAEVESSSLQDGAQRLAAYLVSLAVDGARAVRLPVSKTLVAARLGMKKETLSRLLARLAAAGLIEVRNQEVALLDRGRLAALARAS
jgi:CRP-like cAMP-binding protein